MINGTVASLRGEFTFRILRDVESPEDHDSLFPKISACCLVRGMDWVCQSKPDLSIIRSRAWEKTH